MASIGIRELKQNASAVIRRVASGEVVEVTDRGRAVARIVPLRAVSVLDQLVAEGRATEPAGDLVDVKAVRPHAGERLLSRTLADLRTDER